MTERTFRITTADQFDRLLAILRRMQLPLEVIARPWFKKRTIPQNSRLWKLHTLASAATGYTKAQCHHECLCEFYGYTVVERINPWTKQKEVSREPLEHSSDKDTKRFREFSDFVENWYAEHLGIWLDAQQE